jgi:dihydrofolate reductase
MGKVIVSISMSLDGFIAGADVSSKQPMGKGGERLHKWLFSNSRTENDNKIISETADSSGAVIVGGRTYRTAINDAWGGVSPFTMPAFVLTHNIPIDKKEGFIFVTEGIEKVLIEAKKQAAGKDIWLLGGADIIQQFISLKLIDEIQITFVNVLLEKGIPLFDKINIGQIELQTIRVLTSNEVTHIKYRIVK